MRFADRLFFWMISILTIGFTIFGAWMLSINFQSAVEKEGNQSEKISQTIQYFFEIGYNSTKEFGADYSKNKAVNAVKENANKMVDRIYIYDLVDDSYLYDNGVSKSTEFDLIAKELHSRLYDDVNYVYAVQKVEGRHYSITIMGLQHGVTKVCIGTFRDIEQIYEDRQRLLHQYWIMIGAILTFASFFIFAFARLVTKPIIQLKDVASDIADGDLEKRSDYTKRNEIGALAVSFNQMTDQLLEQMREREMEAKRKEDFTVAFAHELKTPLTSIIGYADMLNSIELDEAEKREAYFYIFSQGKRLESLSFKLLELTGINHQNLSFADISLAELEYYVLETMNPVWKDRKIQGSVSFEPGLLVGEKDLILSLIYNLVDNANKAVSDRESAKVTVTGEFMHDGYQIRVTDNGRGIPEAEISRVTEAFYMVNKSRSRKEGGAGIGMALCDRIIALHEGKFHIESVLGQGTTIAVTFPEAYIEL